MMFRTRMDKNKPCVVKKKYFVGNTVSQDDITASFKFAYDMAMGEGHHRNYRTGGKYHRTSLEIFWDAFRGKIAEFYVYEQFNDENISEVDCSVAGFGVWDRFDFKINNKFVSVKSTKQFGNLLLLETKDYDALGNYIPNNQQYDYFMMVRTQIEVPSDLKKGEWAKGEEVLFNIVNELKIEAELTGVLSNYDFVNQIIKYKYIIRQGQYLNCKTLMDADNYYVHVAELEPVNVILK